jgi:2-keto-3-deoxy-L-rhamnonate aldolase RhmA
MSFRRANCHAVVRVAQNDYQLINWLCDMGVDGVLVPMVNSIEDARRAIEAANTHQRESEVSVHSGRPGMEQGWAHTWKIRILTLH